MYRIYTENVNLPGIQVVMDSHFGGYTILRSLGVWKGHHEQSLVIEVAADSLDAVKAAATEIKSLNKQENVLVTFQPQTTVLV